MTSSTIIEIRCDRWMFATFILNLMNLTIFIIPHIYMILIYFRMSFVHFINVEKMLSINLSQTSHYQSTSIDKIYSIYAFYQCTSNFWDVKLPQIFSLSCHLHSITREISLSLSPSLSFQCMIYIFDLVVMVQNIFQLSILPFSRYINSKTQYHRYYAFAWFRISYHKVHLISF